MNHIPFGNAYFATSTCGGGPYDSGIRRCWAKMCVGVAAPPAECFGNVSGIVAQHGPGEYYANRLEACAWSVDSTSGQGGNWATRYWPFTVCVEKAFDRSMDSDAVLRVGQTCGLAHGIGMAKIASCYQAGAAGDAVVRAAAKATFDHAGTPWVLVNGKQIDPDDVIKEVCAAYRGPQPSGCSTTTATTTAPAKLCE